MKTVVGLYDDLQDAQAAINDLIQAGFDRADISLVTTNRWGESDGTTVTTTAGAAGTTTTDGVTVADAGPDADMADAEMSQMASDVTTGAVTGGVVGGLAGVLLGLGALAIPGFGPVLAAGPLVAGLAGAGIGAAVGGLVGALVSWGVPEDEAELYAESVRRGSILVGLKTEDDRVQQAVGIMNAHAPVDVQRRSEYWRATGWTGHSPEAAAWTPDEVNTDRARYGDYLDYASYAPAFREHYQTTYSATGRDYTAYDPAYRYGYGLANDERYRDYETWDEFEAEARRGWEGGEYAAHGAWEDFKDAARRGWESVKDAFDVESDYADFETGYRQHYQTTFGSTGRAYDWYGPAYRYGYNLATDGRWDEYETWEALEAEARRDWESRSIGGDFNNAEGGGTWDDFKDAIRRGWEDVKDAFDAEDDYFSFTPSFREHYEEAYGTGSHDFDYYDPAYRYGYNLAIDEQYDHYDDWDEFESEARRGWAEFSGSAESTWDEFKDAVRRAWEDVRDALDFEADYAGREPRFREHYETHYRNELRNYEWYEPAYRYGYVLAMDERYDDFDAWEQAEQQAREDWEASDYAGENAWDEVKEAIRQGWESMREAFDDDGEELPRASTGYYRATNG